MRILYFHVCLFYLTMKILMVLQFSGKTSHQGFRVTVQKPPDQSVRRFFKLQYLTNNLMSEGKFLHMIRIHRSNKFLQSFQLAECGQACPKLYQTVSHLHLKNVWSYDIGFFRGLGIYRGRVA